MAYDILKDKNPMSINIKKLQRYNFNFFKLEEVVFFEYIIVKAKSFKFKPFYHSSETIFKETGIKRNKLDAILKRYIELEIISIEVKGFPKVKHFIINFEKVQYYLPKIYQSAENGKLSAHMTKLLADFYTPLVDLYLQKNNKSILKETQKEKIEFDSGWEIFSTLFKDNIRELQLKHNLTTTAIKFNELQLYQTYSIYGEDLITHLNQYFESNPFRGKISEFLKKDKFDEKKNAYIESIKIQDIADANQLLNNLNKTYNNRRENYNNKREKITASKDKKKYPATNLIINKSITQKAVQVLKILTENDISNAFIAYTDAMLNGQIRPNKILPYFFSEKYGSYPVIETYLDQFNVDYIIN